MILMKPGLMVLVLSYLINTPTQADTTYPSLADHFEQCQASEFNTTIYWGEGRFQPLFKSLPNFLQVKPLKEFKLKLVDDLGNPLPQKTLDKSGIYRHRGNNFKRFFGLVRGRTPAAFSLPNEPSLSKRYEAHSFGNCISFWFKLDNLANQPGTAFDPSGQTHNFLVTKPAACVWEGKSPYLYGDDDILGELPYIKLVDYPASPFWIIQYDKGITNYYDLLFDRFKLIEREHVMIEKGARVLYHDDAEFVKIVRPKGAKASDYPVLMYGGRTFNWEADRRASTWPSDKLVTRNMDTVAGPIQSLFFSAYDADKKRFVEAGTLVGSIK